MKQINIAEQSARDAREAHAIACRPDTQFRAPHYTTSPQGLIEETCRALRGTLYLDDLSNFTDEGIEAIGQALAFLGPAAPRIRWSKASGRQFFGGAKKPSQSLIDSYRDYCERANKLLARLGEGK